MINFVTELSESNRYTNLIVITNRLEKKIILKKIKKITVKTIADVFINRFYYYYFLPDIIILNKEPQFIRYL